MPNAELRALRSAWLTERQAIAIYDAEIAVLRRSAWTKARRTTLRLCEAILVEEREHLDSLGPDARVRGLWTGLSALGGCMLGSLLAVLPAVLSWRLHSVAEIQAAREYERALAQVSDPGLREHLQRAAEQERDHSRRFASVS